MEVSVSSRAKDRLELYSSWRIAGIITFITEFGALRKKRADTNCQFRQEIKGTTKYHKDIIYVVTRE